MNVGFDSDVVFMHAATAFNKGFDFYAFVLIKCISFQRFIMLFTIETYGVKGNNQVFCSFMCHRIKVVVDIANNST